MKRFVRLLSANERRLYAYILSLVPNWNDADEIVQETNVRLWEQFDRFIEGTDFGAWACTIAHYQVLTYRKRLSREKLRFSEAFLDAVAEEASISSLEAPPRQRALEGCIGKLNESARQLIKLVYGNGLSVGEAADRVGRTVAATYQALSRARKALRQCIDQTVAQEAER